MSARSARLVVATVAAAAALVAGACSSGSSSSSSGTSTSATASSSTTTSAASSTTPASSGSSTSTSSGSPTSTAPSDRCHTNQLSLDVGPGQGAAGSIYIPLTLRNTSSTVCVIKGYPGVSLLDATNHPIGSPATRAAGTVAAVTLKPGARATVTVHTLNEGIAPGGCWATSTSVKVFPPDERDSLTHDAAITVCGGQFTITPVTAGS